MEAKSFAKRLSSGGAPLIGTLVSMASLDAIDVLCRSGFDWFFVDLEHSTISHAEAKALIQVVAHRAYVLARVGVNSPEAIQKALDVGCDGVVVPLVNSSVEAEAAVRAAKYPPDGERSVGIGRAQGYGTALAPYLESANDEIAVIVQIEHRLAVAALDEILSVKGVDAMFIGPYDLSASMGLVGQVSHEQVRRSVQEIRRKCKAAGMPYGIFSMTGEASAAEIERGASFVVLGLDAMHLFNGARAQLDALRHNG